MTGTELKTIRASLGLTAEKMASLLGYSGSSTSRAIMVYRWQSGNRKIPPVTARLIQLIHTTNNGRVPN